jgi:ATP-dependent DNA ligase
VLAKKIMKEHDITPSDLTDPAFTQHWPAKYKLVMKTKKPNPYPPKKREQSYPKFASKPVKITQRVDPIVRGFVPRQTEKHQSLSSFGGNAYRKDTQQYTGGNMLGISILHKSCLQPVFTQEQAIENASMRR